MIHSAPGRPPIPCVPGCRLCQLLDRDGPDYSPAYRRLFHPDEFPAQPNPPPAATPVPVPIPVTLALLARMKSCPHWQAASDCGCGLNRCAAGQGNQGVVSHRDCFRCLDPDMD